MDQAAEHPRLLGVGSMTPDAADEARARAALRAGRVGSIVAEAASHHQLAEAQRRADDRYTAALCGTSRRADFFTAVDGETDTLRSARAADILFTVREESVAANAARVASTAHAQGQSTMGGELGDRERLHAQRKLACAASAHRPRAFRLEKLCPCAPPLAALAPMADRISTAGSESCLPMLDVLVQMEGVVPLSALRTLAVSCYTARMLVSARMRSPELGVGADDASWVNAAFVARLPGLLRLRVRLGMATMPDRPMRAARSCARA